MFYHSDTSMFILNKVIIQIVKFITIIEFINFLFTQTILKIYTDTQQVADL